MTTGNLSFAAVDAAAARSRDLVTSSRRDDALFVEVEWHPAAAGDHFPLEIAPLYGTTTFDEMSAPTRHRYSMLQAAAFFGGAIWFERIGMRMLVEHAARIPANEFVHEYLLVEIAEECRHSILFGRYFREYGLPVYEPRPTRDTARLVEDLPFRIDDEDAGLILSYLFIFACEQIGDYVCRRMVANELLHPTVRAIARVHITDEARHLSFARHLTRELSTRASDETRRLVATVAPIAIARIANLVLCNPAVYEDLDLPDGARAADASTTWREHHRASLRRVVTFVEELGYLTDDNRSHWQSFGLLVP